MKQISVNTCFILLALFLNACIEEYRPDIETGELNKYVVYGELTDGSEEQLITVALASSVREPNLRPLNDCNVSILDKDGNSYYASEIEDGTYRFKIPPEMLVYGMEYRLDITTPAGTKLVSEYEKLLDCPDIDSVYYIRKSKPTKDPEVFIEGVQFFLNLDTPDDENKYFKFVVIETYEYHAWYALEWYYDGVLHHIDPPDSSHMFCWATNQIKDIFVLNTQELQRNKYKQFPLHFVDNTTQRLEHLYSLLVRQYTMSEEGYVFWDQLRANNIEQGGLYETQPLPAKGNLENLTNPKQSVLGYFQVSSVKTKRIFVSDIPDLEFEYYPECGVWPLAEALRFYHPRTYPVYLAGTRHGPGAEISYDCIFCERSINGGTTERPDFWPEDNEYP